MRQVTPELAKALAVIAGGGCLVYPTETLFALGADGTNAAAAARIYQLKGRDPSKPLPLILSDGGQLPLVTERVSAEAQRLGELFWPGPLSILLPARPDLPDVVSDPRGLTSVRVTSHPVAALLSRESGRPLIATSANVSGKPAVSRLEDLDPGLAGSVECVVGLGPEPAGGAPSTVVEPLAGGALIVHREGVVSLDALRAAGFDPRMA